MDIVRRLEQRRPVSMKEAAENIRKLREENERLRKEIAKGNARESVLYEKCEEWRMEAKRVQADNERLRANAALADENEALRAQLDHVTITYKAEMQEAAEEIRKLRAALTEISMMRAEDMYRGDDDNAAAFIARAALAPPPQR